MNSLKYRVLLVAALLAASVCWSVAQDSGDKGKAATRTITGCLSQGEDANQFVLSAEDGSTWDVRSDSVDLSKHLGHEVEATGAVEHSKMHNMKEDTKDAAQDAGVKKNNTEHGHLAVTDVRMVSDSCKGQ
jgi:hypothetical protein